MSAIASLTPQSLLEIVGIKSIETLQQQHRQWLDSERLTQQAERDVNWSESLAVGNEVFVDEVHALPGCKARNRKKVAINGKHVLREVPERYKVDFASQIGCLTLNNLLFWDKMVV